MMNTLFIKIIRPFSFVIHKYKDFFRNLKFYKKIQLLILVPILIGYLVAVLLYDYSLNLYDKQLYQNSASILSLSSQNIENEIHNLLNIMTTLSTDATLQNFIMELNESETPYDNYICRKNIMNHIYKTLNTRTYIHSITYIDPSMKADTIGSDPLLLSPSDINYFYTLAYKNNGKGSLITKQTPILIYPIREVKNLSLAPLGAIIISVNLDKLVQFTINTNNIIEDFFICKNRNEILYHYDDSRPISPEYFNITSDFSIKKIDGTSMFITHQKSKYSNWTYYYTIEYNSIFLIFNKLKLLVFFIFSILFAFLIFVSTRFSNSVTKPLSKLAKQMNSIQNIDFEISNISFSPNIRKDEIGELQRSYQFMIKKIEELIQNNYKNQILLKDTKYKVLRAQINPHFIYNTLDSIYWMAINENNKDIATMVFSLGKLLRENIKKDTLILIPLRQELLILSYYINIQQIRFHERLKIILNIQEEAQSYNVPWMILQPLFENSINYGAEQRADTCIIELTIYIENSYVHIEIKDNGIGIEDNILEKLKSGEKKPSGHGIGLSNIEQRLKYIYEDNYHFVISNIPEGGTFVSIIFPILNNLPN